MRARQTLAALIAAIASTTLPAAAADGVLIAQKVTNGTTTTTHQSQIEKTRMRSELTSATGRKQVVIFDGAAQVLRMLDDEGKTYTEMSKADTERLRAQMNGAMAQVQEQMKNLPPEQRARMEALMKGRGVIPATTEPTTYKKVGTDKVGKWTCDKYEGTRNGEKVSEVCTVGPSALGFTPGDFEVTQQLAEFFSNMMPQLAEGLFRIGSAAPNANSFSGLPVRFVSFRAGAPQMTSEVTDASRQSFPDALFQVPAGYQKREFPGTGRGRGRQ